MVRGGGGGGGKGAAGVVVTMVVPAGHERAVGRALLSELLAYEAVLLSTCTVGAYIVQLLAPW